ncbi:MAG: polysaccharide biosynthesis protein [Hyphomonadaceae bacterium]
MKPIHEAKRAVALTLSFDIIVAFMAMLIAIEARWRLFGEFTARPFPDHIPLTASMIFAFSAMISFLLLQVHRQVWRHVGWPDALKIVQAAGLAFLVFLPVMFLWNRLDGFPRASLLIALPLWLTFLFSGRMLALLRSTNRPLQIFTTRRQDAPPTILVGDQDALAEALRQMERAPEGSPLRVLGLIETNEQAHGRVIRGATVQGGLNDLGNRLDLLNARYGSYPWVATVGDARSRANMRTILAQTSERGSKIMSIATGNEGAQLQKVRPTDLLGRRERKIELDPIKNLVGGTRLFVTGAGGTIGSELVEQCAELDPSHITLFDNSEFNLYQIDYLLKSRFPDLEIVSVLGDVRDSVRLTQIMASSNPDIVIHAAALKHVPLMEANPCEAILTNIGGAANATRAALACQADRFVLISTDKAVDPSNVMGATKRASELVVSDIAEGSSMAVSIVRFGNVLGSSGSVVPRFEQQIADGGPVTVMDEDITRYFMTVEEAVYLVLHAAAGKIETGTANLYVLDMGRPIKIKTLAESMIRMKGLVPDVDIEITYPGLRPGDKMYETLTYDSEHLSPTSIEGVFKVSDAVNDRVNVELAVEHLLNIASARDSLKTLPLLNQLVGISDDETDTSKLASIG